MHAHWKGQIAFGLVNVPVTLYSAEERADLHFKLIDSRNAARIRYERVNEETGEEVLGQSSRVTNTTRATT